MRACALQATMTVLWWGLVLYRWPWLYCDEGLCFTGDHDCIVMRACALQATMAVLWCVLCCGRCALCCLRIPSVEDCDHCSWRAGQREIPHTARHRSVQLFFSLPVYLQFCTSDIMFVFRKQHFIHVICCQCVRVLLLLAYIVNIYIYEFNCLPEFHENEVLREIEQVRNFLRCVWKESDAVHYSSLKTRSHCGFTFSFFPWFCFEGFLKRFGDRGEEFGF